MDRNTQSPLKNNTTNRSLSARRAWIEILRAGSCSYDGASLSARRAWIEMVMLGLVLILPVSLSARRAWIEIASGTLSDTSDVKGRSPQGERG